MQQSALRGLEQLEEYKDTIFQLFPSLPRYYIDQWSISKLDALTLGYLLGYLSRKIVVLDIGTFIGTSGFYLASVPEVHKVISVDPNPTLSEEYNRTSGVIDNMKDFRLLRHLRVLEVAEAALAKFPYQREKIQLREGIVGASQVSIQGDFVHNPQKQRVPMPTDLGEAQLVAFVDGLHTKEAIRADLEAIFEQNSDAIAIVHDCQYGNGWGPSVRAGIASFVEESLHKYHFHILKRLLPGLNPPNLGIVYPDKHAAKVEHIMPELLTPLQFSERIVLPELLDPLQSLKSSIALGAHTVRAHRRKGSNLSSRSLT
jgi:hypothetical protein